MTRIDRIIVARVFFRIFIVVLVIFSLIALVESLDSWRFKKLSEVGGPPLAILAIVTNATRWTIKTLPVTVLIGGILGVLDLQSRRELTIIRAAGISIWRVMAAPVLVLIALSLVVALYGETLNTQVNRTLNPSPPVNNSGLTAGELWLEQSAGGQRYILQAGKLTQQGQHLYNVMLFFTEQGVSRRISAPEATLKPGAWVLHDALEMDLNGAPKPLGDFEIETGSTAADLKVQLGSTEDYTIFELAAVLSDSLTEPTTRAAATTRFLRLSSLPILLTGSLLIAFAFTAGYRRTNKYGSSILYGIVLGFVVFVVTEMGERAGSSGALNPIVAAIGPAFFAVTIGVTVLLYKEDGRA